jgi:predicted nucleic acid-binding protein
MTGFDTNILIYSCDHADTRRQQRALELLASAPDGVLLWQVASEFVAASRKLASQGFTPSHAWARLHEFMDVLPLILPSPKVIGYAQALHVDQGFSFWDAMIVGACWPAPCRRPDERDIPVEAWVQLPGPAALNALGACLMDRKNSRNRPARRRRPTAQKPPAFSSTGPDTSNTSATKCTSIPVFTAHCRSRSGATGTDRSLGQGM